MNASFCILRCNISSAAAALTSAPHRAPNTSPDVPLTQQRRVPTQLASLPADQLCLIGSLKVAQSCLTLRNIMDCSPPGSSVHGILQARILEWVAMPFSRGSSWPRDWTHVSCLSCTAGVFFTVWATRVLTSYQPKQFFKQSDHIFSLEAMVIFQSKIPKVYLQPDLSSEPWTHILNWPNFHSNSLYLIFQTLHICILASLKLVPMPSCPTCQGHYQPPSIWSHNHVGYWFLFSPITVHPLSLSHGSVPFMLPHFQ